MGIFNFFKRGPKKELRQTQTERRFLPRWQIDYQAKIRWEGVGEFVPCQIRDLNFRGLQISLSQKLPDNCAKLELRLSEDFIFSAEIKILWESAREDGYVYGASFTRLRDADKERLYQFIFHNFPDHIERHIKGNQ
jgi:hypothetical protein